MCRAAFRCTSPGAWTNFESSANENAKSGLVIMTRNESTIAFHRASEILRDFTLVGSLEAFQEMAFEGLHGAARPRTPRQAPPSIQREGG